MKTLKALCFIDTIVDGSVDKRLVCEPLFNKQPPQNKECLSVKKTRFERNKKEMRLYHYFWKFLDQKSRYKYRSCQRNSWSDKWRLENGVLQRTSKSPACSEKAPFTVHGKGANVLSNPFSKSHRTVRPAPLQTGRWHFSSKRRRSR